MSKIVLAFSGGLDTTFCAIWLREQTGSEIVTVCVDTGGFSDEELAEIAAHAGRLGVAEHRTVDAKQVVYDRFVSYLIKGNCLRGGVYPVSVGAERTAQAEAVVKVAREIGATGVAHGSTRAGNDQIRFDVAIRTLAPEMTIHAPIRELGWSRQQESDWLKEHGVDVPVKTVRYSINEGLFGTTIGGGETHDPWAMPPEEAYTATIAPTEGPDDAEELTLGFAKGLPVSIDGQAMDGVTLVDTLNERAARHGVGRGMHVGDTILGVKGRLAFEAPGPLILIQAHRELEKLVQTRWQSYWRETLGSFYGNLLHEAQYYDPVMRDLEAFLDSANSRVTGDVKVRLFKGGVTVTGTRSPYSLMDANVAVYGEGASAWTGEEAKGFAQLYGMASMLARRSADRAEEGGSA
ncbi:MAG: argininosuccinate synthase [Planctomycetota bacterium]|nr:argininosuccinate synthase [Planctomycetota bacterium]